MGFDNLLTNFIFYANIFSTTKKSLTTDGNVDNHRGIRDLQCRPSGQYLNVFRYCPFVISETIFVFQYAAAYCQNVFHL